MQTPHRSETEPTRVGRVIAGIRSAGIDLWFPVFVVCAVLLLSAFRVSGSSIPILSGDGTPDSKALIVGVTRPIRSDEWQAWSPMKTGVVRAGFPATQMYGMGTVDLANSWRPQLPSRSLGAALYAPFNLPLVLLPVDQGFALYWWVPFAACALGIYGWLRAMRIGRGVALFAALLAATAPVAVWWSGWWCQTVAAGVIPCAIFIGAVRLWERHRYWALAAAVVAALAAANLPWYYQPWAIPSAMFFGGVTCLWGLGDARTRRPFLLLAALGGSVFVAEQLVYYLHERAYYQALGDTVYPGQRRNDGGGVTLAQVFSSLYPTVLASNKGSLLQQTNLTEISMGWTIFAPLTAATAALGRRAIRNDRESILLFGSLGLAAVMTSWCFVRWPRALGRITGFVFVQPGRLAPWVGLFWLVAFALLFGTPERRQRLFAELGRSGAVIVTAVTVFTAAWGATDFRATYLPALTGFQMWIPIVIVGIVVALLWSRLWPVALGIAATCAVVSGALVNPLMVGTANLDSSRPAAIVRRVNARDVAPVHGTWAADAGPANALINGQGVNSLSTLNDPVDARGWRVLDPSGQYEDNWNRFAYVTFAWQPGLEEPVIDSPYADQVVVHTDPCDPRLSKLGLRAVVSATPLDGACLTKRADFEWQGMPYAVYDRR